MASAVIQFLPHPHSLHQLHPSSNPSQFHIHNLPHLKKHHLTIKCTSSNDSAPEPDFPTPPPGSETTISPDKFPIEKRKRSEITRDRRSRTSLVKPEPPNFEIGWKRTKEIPLEKPKGYVIMDFLEKLVGLMEREFGSVALLVKAGEIVAERAREEAEVLREEGEVDERMVTELFRVLKLMEMDLAMVKAAVKEETLNERIEQAKDAKDEAVVHHVLFFAISDNNPSDSVPTPDKIFIGVGEGNPETWIVDPDQSDRFRMLKKMRFKLVGGKDKEDVHHGIEVVDRLFPVDVWTDYKDTLLGNVGSIQKGAIYLVAATVSGKECKITLRSQMYFKTV